MKAAIISTGQAFLLAALIAQYPNLESELKQISPAQVQSRFADGNAYIRTEITGAGGMFPLIDTSTLEKVGTSSFKGKALTSGVKMAITHIRFGVAQVAPTNTTKPAGQTYTNKYSDVDPALRAANLVVVKDGKRIIDKPLLECLSLANVEGMVGKADSYELDALRYIEGDQELDIYINFAPDVALATDKKTFVSVEFIGPRVMGS